MIELIPVAVLQNRITQASRKGITYFLRSRDSLTAFPVPADVFAATAIWSISFNSISAWRGERDRNSDASALSRLPRKNNHRGDSATNRLPSTNNTPGGSETQKMRRQAWSLNANNAAASEDFATASTR